MIWSSGCLIIREKPPFVDDECYECYEIDMICMDINRLNNFCLTNLI